MGSDRARATEAGTIRRMVAEEVPQRESAEVDPRVGCARKSPEARAEGENPIGHPKQKAPSWGFLFESNDRVKRRSRKDQKLALTV